MGFFDRFKRKHEVVPSSLPKVARAEAAMGKKSDDTLSKPAQDAGKNMQKGGREAHMQDDRGILVKPVVTEKATRLAGVGQYVFFVAPRASKGAIKDAVQHRYGVKPVAVTVQRYEGSTVRFGRRFGVTKGFKKAIVTLPKGQTIDVMKSGGQE